MAPDTSHLPSVALGDVDEAAALQTRTDRKYVVTADVVDELLHGLDASVLEIGGRRSFRYRSTYFDTEELESYLGAARRHPFRWKVRTRDYVDTGSRWLEVKRRDRRGNTLKERVGHDAGAEELDRPAIEFVASFERLDDVAERLVRALTTSYERTTLLLDGARVTIDRDVSASTPDGRIAAVDGYVVETKTTRAGSPADRLLWSLGERPCKISKFGVGMAALHPELPANKWHRTLRRHVAIAE